MSIHTSTAPVAVDVRAARRAGLLFVVAFVSFVAFVATIIVGDRERQEALTAAANDLGVGVNDVPADAFVSVLREHPTPLPVALVMLALTAGSALTFVMAIRQSGRLVPPGRGPQVARILAWLAAPTFPLLLVGELVVARTQIGTSFTDPFAALQIPAANYWAGSLGAVALILIALSLRARGLVPRMSIVVIALCGLILTASFFGGAPPIGPLLCGMLLGIALVRTRSSI